MAIVELFVCVGVVGVVGVDGVEESLLIFFGDGGGCGVSSPETAQPLLEVSMVGVVVVELECFLLLTRLPSPVLLLFVVVVLVVMGERTSFDLLLLLFLLLLLSSGVMIMEGRDGKSSCPASSSMSSSSPSGTTLVGAAVISKSSFWPVVSVDGVVEKEGKW